MAQLRQDFKEYDRRDVEILVVGPDDQAAFKEYWAKNDLPFTGLPDPDHRVSNLYGQQVKIFRMGRMPAMTLIDKDGKIRFFHYANSMSDIPPNKAVLSYIDKLVEETLAAVP
jgi:peroxiredoxin Q/BCP